MKRRKKLLEQLSKTEVGIDWGSILDGYFRLLYGLPIKIQIGIACFMMYRYLPIFEKNQPEITWPRQLLKNVAKWVEENERCIPDYGTFQFPADSAFRSSFDGLLDAYYYRTNPYKLTSGCIYAIQFAINARRSNVWAADDPEAVEIDKSALDNPEIYLAPERLPSRNVAAIAVVQREWQEVAKWLINEQIWTYTDTVNLEDMEQKLEYWSGGAYLL